MKNMEKSGWSQKNLNMLSYAAIGLIVWVFLFSSLIFVQENLLDRTLSSIGNENRIWFVLWSFFVCSALIINVKLLTIKLGLTGKKAIAFDIFVYANMIFAIAQAVIIDPKYNSEHTLLALIMSFHGFAIILICLGMVYVNKLSTEKRIHKRTLLYFTIVILLGAINLKTMIAIKKLFALRQWATAMGVIIVSLLLQHQQVPVKGEVVSESLVEDTISQ